ncbi:DUF4349 domain-containing protein [Micromonospora costi]|uniref:DUF4349 domain-containing protein n=1 Tax=Micromonospora costi TaxID=1530042 RepID=A0A3B0ACV8_9ACTN|nr:DUF4349 domain-containing protein [Micromonospora costi]RKN58412.1 DUF4349 domain-containing protein [Micromonospora costi]
MDGRTTRRRSVALAAMGLTAALALGGCSASGDSGSEATSARGPAADSANGGAADRDAAGAGAPGARAPGTGAPGSPDLRVDQRSIIYTGTMLIRVDDVDGKSRRAVEMVTAAGGFVGADQRTSADADARSELQLRVPAARFTAVVDELAKLGRQERREVHTEDVTEETVDLDARIATQRARVDSARRLLARATTITELVSLESELGKREADLASLEAKKRRLADLTALSTITLTLVGEDVTTADEETELGFLVGLSNGWRVFLVSMTLLLTVLGAVLPWLVAFGVPLAVLLVALRRRRRRRSEPPVSAPPPVPAARSAP